MSGYGSDSHESKNNIFGNEYVNFDQFLMQHNFGGNSTQYYNNSPSTMNYSYSTPYSNSSNGTLEENQSSYNQYSGFYQPQPQPGFDFNPNLVHNSNLMATANEFVPNFSPTTVAAMPAPGTSPLMANAVAFVPRSAAFNESPATVVMAANSTSDGPASAPSDAVSLQNFTSNSRSNFSSKQDALMNALRKTHLDDPMVATAQSSSGGAIKKVKSGSSREGKKESAGWILTIKSLTHLFRHRQSTQQHQQRKPYEVSIARE